MKAFPDPIVFELPQLFQEIAWMMPDGSPPLKNSRGW
jgi:hypothetical protein